MIAFLVPVLNRPQHVRPLLESIYESTPDAHVVFIADPDDNREIDEIQAFENCLEAQFGPLKVTLLLSGGNYASKINHAVRETEEPLLFLGADDLRPQLGWLEAAREQIDDGFECVGINDQLPRRREHSTHFLMTREYALRPTIDGRRGPLAEAYHHNFVDDELIATAMSRGTYAYAERARMIHLHPIVRSAADDETYRKGRSTFDEDKALFNERSALWM